jgi:hypothetical protein
MQNHHRGTAIMLLRDNDNHLAMMDRRSAGLVPGVRFDATDSVLNNPDGALTDSAPDVCPEKHPQYMGRT